MTKELCRKFIDYYDRIGEDMWRPEDRYLIDACRALEQAMGLVELGLTGWGHQELTDAEALLREWEGARKS